MPFNLRRHLGEGTEARVTEPMDVPEDSVWDDDGGRTSTRVKKSLQARFFRGDRHLSAEVVYVAKDSERKRLRRKGLIKLCVHDAARSILVLTVDPAKLERCN